MSVTPVLGGVSAVVALACVGLFSVGLVKGISGFGTGLLAIPIISELFSPTLALAALTVPLWLSNVHLVAERGVPRRLVADHRGHITVAVAASAAGVLGVTVLPEYVVYLALGGYIALYVVSRHVSWDTGGAVSRSRGDIVAGGVGGFITGAFLSGGPVFVSYFQSLDISEEEFVAVLGFIFTLTNMVRILPLYATGSFTASETLTGLAFLVPLSLGVATGDRVRPLVPRNAFDRFVELLLVAVALNLLLDGVHAAV